jgi:hypothetical protein
MAQQDIEQPPATPERERELAEARSELVNIALRQNIKPAETFDELLGDGGPDDETADDMIRAIDGWR